MHKAVLFLLQHVANTAPGPVAERAHQFMGEVQMEVETFFQIKGYTGDLTSVVQDLQGRDVSDLITASSGVQDLQGRDILFQGCSVVDPQPEE